MSRRTKEVRADILFDAVAHSDEVTAAALAPEAGLLATAGKDRVVRVWRLGEPRPLLTLPGPKGSVRALRWNHSGRLIIAGDSMGHVLVWDLQRNNVLRVSHESTDVEVLAVAWHPFGRLAASSASDGSVEVWDLEQQRSIQQFGLPQDTACILEFTPDGRQLLVGTLEGGILTWDLQTARRTGQLELFGGDSAAAGWISLHPQLGMAAVLSDSGKLQLVKVGELGKHGSVTALNPPDLKNGEILHAHLLPSPPSSGGTSGPFFLAVVRAGRVSVLEGDPSDRLKRFREVLRDSLLPQEQQKSCGWTLLCSITGSVPCGPEQQRQLASGIFSVLTDPKTSAVRVVFVPVTFGHQDQQPTTQEDDGFEMAKPSAAQLDCPRTPESEEFPDNSEDEDDFQKGDGQEYQPSPSRPRSGSISLTPAGVAFQQPRVSTPGPMDERMPVPALSPVRRMRVVPAVTVSPPRSSYTGVGSSAVAMLTKSTLRASGLSAASTSPSVSITTSVRRNGEGGGAGGGSLTPLSFRRRLANSPLASPLAIGIQQRSAGGIRFDLSLDDNADDGVFGGDFSDIQDSDPETPLEDDEDEEGGQQFDSVDESDFSPVKRPSAQDGAVGFRGNSTNGGVGDSDQHQATRHGQQQRRQPAAAAASQQLMDANEAAKPNRSQNEVAAGLAASADVNPVADHHLMVMRVLERRLERLGELRELWEGGEILEALRRLASTKELQQQSENLAVAADFLRAVWTGQERLPNAWNWLLSAPTSAIARILPPLLDSQFETHRRLALAWLELLVSRLPRLADVESLPRLLEAEQHLAALIPRLWRIVSGKSSPSLDSSDANDDLQVGRTTSQLAQAVLAQYDAYCRRL